MGTDDNGYELAVCHQLAKAAKLRHPTDLSPDSSPVLGKTADTPTMPSDPITYPPRRQRGHAARQRPPNNLEAPGLPSKGRASRRGAAAAVA
jgi:hypothetical protein